MVHTLYYPQSLPIASSSSPSSVATSSVLHLLNGGQSFLVDRNLEMDTMKRSTKTVNFAEVEAIEIKSPLPPSLPPPSTNDLQSRWYSKDELNTMKSRAVQLSVYRRQVFGPHALPRGMEACTKQRSEHRKNVARYVVLAHKMGRGEEYTAELSQKLSSWNVDLAFTDACRDYFEIYRPGMVHLVPPVLTGPPKIALVPKRGAPTNVLTLQHQSRRVRRKLSP
jgi:hypothetical protein